MKNPTFANRWNADLIDDYYEAWLREPESLDEGWRAFFEGFSLGQNGDAGASGPSSSTASIPGDHKKQARFTGAIFAYRSIGHTQARINPLLEETPENPRLKLDRLGFNPSDLDREFDTGNYLGGQIMTVRELLRNLSETYCGSIGVEYLHIQDTPKRRWLQARMEPNRNRPDFSGEKCRRILDRVLAAETFEKFLQTRYVGQKRFSLEGGETIIAALDALIQHAPQSGVERMVMGMAHRGRLNVLANILGKSHEFIFREFSENYIPDTRFGDGDVKYHLGFDSVVKSADGAEVGLYLAANPSHLEAVNPVVEGRARAHQRILGDTDRRRKVVPILLHGDAAFAGQGVVAEVLNFSKLKGYRTGGTIHFVINNQIGFTTDPSDARSTRYCTDVAKMIEVPIFHVNGDDPLAMVHVAELAMDYRQTFNEDVVIDMYCYRRHGHNEADEPKFTQPLLYRKIDQHPLISETLEGRLREDGILEKKATHSLRQAHEKTLDAAFDKLRKGNEEKESEDSPQSRDQMLEGSNAVFQGAYSFESAVTGVPPQALRRVAEALTRFPDEFNANPKIQRQLKTKWKNFEKGSGIDWAFAEALAFGTLLLDGSPVRLSGQDSERGTFSQRHLALYDTETRERFVPLLNLSENQATLCVYNSLLSEAAVLGFDYGYSLDYPQMLCIWEAQFGDFANGAQVIIDQFITSSESKWQRVSGLVLLLPHGYEGQGPEHSSARLERWLQACAEDNIQVCNLTTPAQYFHVLRRQMKRDSRRPLIIMSPKSLLRHRECVSSVEEFSKGTFQEVIEDPEQSKACNRLILCSGKVYYDLIAHRRDQQIADTHIVRVEQIYPLNRERLGEILQYYDGVEHFVWCQEEPRNMGAWSFIAPLIGEISGRLPRYAGRRPAASTAVGSLARHKNEQARLIQEAFAN